MIFMCCTACKEERRFSSWQITGKQVLPLMADDLRTAIHLKTNIENTIISDIKKLAAHHMKVSARFYRSGQEI